RLLARRFRSRQPATESAGVAGEAGESEGDEALARAQIALAKANESVHRLSRLVDDLLDDAQIRDGRFALNLQTCDLGSIVQAAVEEQRMLAPTRSLWLTMPIAGPVPVYADPMRIRQVVTNYLTNALKYSKEDQPVDVRLEVEANGERVAAGAG